MPLRDLFSAPHSERTAREILAGEPKRDDALGLSHDVAARFVGASLPGNSGADHLTDVNEALYGVGLHGALWPGTVALVVPFRHRAELAAFLDTDSQYRQVQANWTNSQIRPLPQHCSVVSAGRIVLFGEMLRYGISYWIGAPWTDWRGTTGDADTARVHRTPAPLLRVITDRDIVPQNLSYTVVPFSMHVDGTTDAEPGDNFEATTSIRIPPHATSLVVVFRDDTAATAGLDPPAAAATYETWWHLGGVNMWARGDDTLDITTDVYAFALDVPPGADGVHFQRLAGDTLYHSVEVR